MARAECSSLVIDSERPDESAIRWRAIGRICRVIQHAIDALPYRLTLIPEDEAMVQLCAEDRVHDLFCPCTRDVNGKVKKKKEKKKRKREAEFKK